MQSSNLVIENPVIYSLTHAHALFSICSLQDRKAETSQLMGMIHEEQSEAEAALAAIVPEEEQAKVRQHVLYPCALPAHCQSAFWFGNACSKERLGYGASHSLLKLKPVCSIKEMSCCPPLLPVTHSQQQTARLCPVNFVSHLQYKREWLITFCARTGSSRPQGCVQNILRVAVQKG